MPVAVNSMAAIAPAQGLDSKVAEPQCGRLPPRHSVTVGLVIPLDDWAH